MLDTFTDVTKLVESFGLVCNMTCHNQLELGEKKIRNSEMLQLLKPHTLCEISLKNEI